jgi:acid phosphatase
VIVVMKENHGYAEIIGSGQAPYINTLATQGALFTNSFAITHPRQPNYLALFSGSKHGIIDDSCPHTFTGRSLESMLLAAGKTFKGYSEDFPAVGSQVCTSGKYAQARSVD